MKVEKLNLKTKLGLHELKNTSNNEMKEKMHLYNESQFWKELGENHEFINDLFDEMTSSKMIAKNNQYHVAQHFAKLSNADSLLY